MLSAALSAVALLALSSPALAIGEDGVLALTDATFGDYIGKDAAALVE